MAKQWRSENIASSSKRKLRKRAAKAWRLPRWLAAKRGAAAKHRAAGASASGIEK
jgi:hypothetical protein